MHAAAFDGAGRVVLVRHTYSPGWRLPGGGIKRREAPRAAILRELREEIGLTGHGAVRHAVTLEHRPEYRRGIADIFIVEEVVLTPTRSIEIEEVASFALGDLPPDTSNLTRRILRAIEDQEPYVVWQAWRSPSDRSRPPRAGRSDKASQARSV